MLGTKRGKFTDGRDVNPYEVGSVKAKRQEIDGLNPNACCTSSSTAKNDTKGSLEFRKL